MTAEVLNFPGAGSDPRPNGICVKAYGAVITWSRLAPFDENDYHYVKITPKVKLTPFEEQGRTREEIFRHYTSLGFNPYDL